MRIFLDMDGVIADFHKQVGRIYGINDLSKTWPNKGSWDLAKAVNLSRPEHSPITDSMVWKFVEKFKTPFWSTIELLPWAELLYSTLCNLGEVYILTSPTDSKYCFEGKLAWIREHISVLNLCIFCPTELKYLLSTPDSFLIDDHEDTCRDFDVKGAGHSFLFPRPWNNPPVPTSWSNPEVIVGFIVSEIQYWRQK